MRISAGNGVSAGLILSPAEPAPAHVERKDWSDLGPRILSSLVLASAGVICAIYGGPWLAGICGAAVVAMSYEWARMSEPENTTPAFLLAWAGSLGMVMFASWHQLWYGVAWMTACAAISAARRRTLAGIIETGGGTLYIGLPCGIFVWLRDRSADGLETIIALFLIIWAADIFAYFGGKLIGGPKIARGLSPNKTWSGIVAGTLAGACAGFACGTLFHTPPHLQMAWIAIGAIVAITGLMGDLFESFLKRRFGVKDASRLIPGHGGVLDRIDSLMASTLLTGAVFAFAPADISVLFGSGL